MITLNAAQGSLEWVKARIGVATASQFHRIITDKKMERSASLEGYAHELLAEQLLGVPMNGASSAFMERGSLLERQAVGWYELQRELDTEPIGFVLRDDRRVGCSPDRFVGTTGLLEIKCPTAPVHVSYLLSDEGIGYRAQVQGQLWICEREWSDTLSWHPELPCALVRITRDDRFIAALDRCVTQLLDYLEDARHALQQRYDIGGAPALAA